MERLAQLPWSLWFEHAVLTLCTASLIRLTAKLRAVIICWSHCHFRHGQNDSWPKRNGVFLWKTVFNYTVEMFVSLTQVIQEHCQTLRDPPGQNSTKYGAWSEGDGDE